MLHTYVVVFDVFFLRSCLGYTFSHAYTNSHNYMIHFWICRWSDAYVSIHCLSFGGTTYFKSGPAEDENQDGILSPAEFLAAMNLPSVKNFLHSMDVNIRDIGPLFEILDDGSLGKNERKFMPGIGRSHFLGCAPIWANCFWRRCEF